MGKVININENDLKRIVKRVLNERQQLNEEVLTATLIGWGLYAAGAYLGLGVLSSLFGSGREGLDKLVKDCGNPDLMGKKAQSDYEINSIVNELDKAAPSGEGLAGYFRQSDEEGIGTALEKIKSIPDFCVVNKNFKAETNRDLIDSIDAAFKSDTWYAGYASWDKYVYTPLKNAIKYTKNQTEKGVENVENKKEETPGEETPGDKKTGDKKTGSGGSGDGSVSDLQKLLKDKGFDIGSHGVDGKFGVDTLAAALKALRS